MHQNNQCDKTVPFFRSYLTIPYHTQNYRLTTLHCLLHIHIPEGWGEVDIERDEYVNGRILTTLGVFPIKSQQERISRDANKTSTFARASFPSLRGGAQDLGVDGWGKEVPFITGGIHCYLVTADCN